MEGQHKERTGLDNPKNAFAFAEFLIGQFAKTIVVFLRQDFGARYFNVSDFLGSMATFAVYTFLFLMFFAGKTGNKRPGDNSDDGTILGLFFLGFIAMSIYHQYIASRRERSGRRWHSRYAGTSFFSFLYPTDIYIVQRYIEPILAVIAGYAAYNYLNQPLGLWLVFAGLCLGAIEQFQAARSRNRLLDAIDAQIEAQNLGAALAGNKTAEETEGFVLPVPSYYSTAQRRALEDGMTRLDPALQAILDVPESEAEPKSTQKPEQTIAQMLDPN